MKTRYPIFVISKGRADCCLTARFLAKDKVPFKLVVEPQEAELYRKEFGKHVVVLPFSNLGLGSIPARNWVWEQAKKMRAKRHWILDDNILGIWRRYATKKYSCESSVAFRACEDFVDRYSNVAIAGMNYYMFVIVGVKMPPFYQNVHVYSCLLIQTDLEQRWRGRYNEDTDLCLQVLSAGLCTILFNAFMVWKMTTMTMKGGNTAELYKDNGRLKMAESLRRQWPHIVEVKRRFRRPQHVVKGAWRNFDTALKLAPGVSREKLKKLKPNDYGMRLVKR